MLEEHFEERNKRKASIESSGIARA